jgi:DNA-binding NarL/FixJ family response regulator
MSTIKYIIADDHNIFRKGVKLSLSTDLQLQCIGEASDGNELLQMMENEAPDVVLLDIRMPNMDGEQAIKQIKEQFPQVKVLIVSMHEESHQILRMMKMGANGYLMKNADPEEMQRAIHAAVEKGKFLSEKVSAILLENVKTPKAKYVKLTEREIEVIKLICAQKNAQEIADQLFMSKRTVEGMRTTIMEKTDTKNMAGLVLYAVKNGLVGDDV